MTGQDIDDLAETLIGTCLTLDEAMGMRGTSGTHEGLKDKLKLHNCAACCRCGWWYELTDLNGVEECDECSAG